MKDAILNLTYAIEDNPNLYGTMMPLVYWVWLMFNDGYWFHFWTELQPDYQWPQRYSQWDEF